MENSKFETFLSELKPRTRANYRMYILKFCTETNTSIADLEEKLSPIEIKHLLLQYYNNNVDKMPRNTRLAVVCAVRSFCNSDLMQKPLKFKRGQLGKPEHDKNSHNFTTEELKQMFLVGDTFEKAFLATAVSCGYEISSFLKLKREKIKALIDQAKANNENFVYFEDERGKEEEPRLLVLNPLAIEWINKFLEVNKDKQFSESLFAITKNTVPHILQRLVKQAGIKPTGKLRFHRLRAWVEQALSRADLNKFEIDYIMGHALDSVNRAYLLSLKTNIEQKYPYAYDHFLNITNGNGNGVETKRRVLALEEQLKEKDAKITELEARLKSTDSENKTKIDQLFKMFDDLKESTGLNTQEIMQIRKQRQQAKEKQ